MYFLGIDHGTRGIRGALLSDTSRQESFEPKPTYFFEIHRFPHKEENDFPSIIERIEEFVPSSEIRLTVLTYSMGDDFNEITDIKTLMNRGIKSIEGAGRIVGLGTAVFEELKKSELKVIALPGIHRKTPTLLPEFRILYSHIAAPDKVGSTYHASLFLREQGMPGKNFILTDTGANTVSILVMDGKLVGGIDAIAGAPGLFQGPIDLEGIRKIDSLGIRANTVFSQGGLFPSLAEKEIISTPNFHERYRTLASAIAMEVMGLTVFLPAPEAVIVTGSAHQIDFEIFSRVLKKRLRGLNIMYLNSMSSALGSAEIARDLHGGKREFLGITVK